MFFMHKIFMKLLILRKNVSKLTAEISNIEALQGNELCQMNSQSLGWTFLITLLKSGEIILVLT